MSGGVVRWPPGRYVAEIVTEPAPPRRRRLLPSARLFLLADARNRLIERMRTVERFGRLALTSGLSDRDQIAELHERARRLRLAADRIDRAMDRTPTVQR